MKIQDRIAHISNYINGLKSEENSFSNALMIENMESHLSDLKIILAAEERENTHLDVLELRLKGASVDKGNIRLDKLSSLSNSFCNLFYQIMTKVSYGKSNHKINHKVKEYANLRLAGIQHGSTKLILTLSNNQPEFFETPISMSLSTLFNAFDIENDKSFLTKIDLLDLFCLEKLRNFLNICLKQNIEFDLSWIGQFSEGKKIVILTHDKIEGYVSIINEIEVKNSIEKELSGKITLLSEAGRIDIDNEDGKTKVEFTKEQLSLIQEKCQIGTFIRMVVTETTFLQKNINNSKQIYKLKSFK